MPNFTKISFYNDESGSPVIAWLGRRDFLLARAAPGFSVWASHSDFLLERDALFIGYGAAGVTARRQHVSFAAFERWTRLTGSPADVDGLDEFAAHWRYRAENPDAGVIGRFGIPGDPERNIIAAAGVQCVRIRPEIYVRWRDDYVRVGLLPPPDLDVYAAHVVDCCLPGSADARWPAVSSK